MNPEYDFSEITVSFNGKVIGNLEAISTEPIVCTPEIDLNEKEELKIINTNSCATVTLENFEINPEFVNTILPKDTLFKVIMTQANYPRGNKLPKKKRIRNKWIKKYHKEITWNDCMVL
jgi:hypothetical protein